MTVGLDAEKKTLNIKQELIFIFNFHPSDSYPDFCFPTKDSNSYQVVFDSDLEIFGGSNRISRDTIYNSSKHNHFNDNCIKIYSPSRTCMVLEKL